MHGGERCGAGSVKTAVFKVLTAARSHSRFGKDYGFGLSEVEEFAIGVLRARDLFIFDDFSIPKIDIAIGIRGDIGFVSDDDGRNALLPIQVLKDGHDLDAGTGIEGAGRLVGEDDLRVIHQCAGDGNALLLTAG